MSRCNPALRWGAGTTRDKAIDTAAAREMEQRLAAMRRDRDATDRMWSQPAAEKTIQNIPTCQLTPQEEGNKKYITFRSSN